MKNLFLLIMLLLAFMPIGHAQFTPNRNFQYKLLCITVYEQPNYQGRSVEFCDAGVHQAPFTIKSMRVPQGYDVYSTGAGECFGGMIYTTDISYLSECQQPNKIAILALPSTKPIEITLRDISYNIHNNDCKRMYGSVGMSITLQDQGYTAYGFGEIDAGYNLISWQKGPARDIIESTNSPNRLNIIRTVRIDPGIWAKCKVNIYTQLSSAHKGCDLCSDFTWDIKMPTQKQYVISLEAAMNLYAPTGSIMKVGNYPFDSRHSATLYFGLRKL